MLTKRQLMLIILAVISILIALGTLIRTKKWEAKMLQPMPETIYYQSETGELIPDQNDDGDALQSDFDALLSGEGISELYEGESDYGFTGVQN